MSSHTTERGRLKDSAQRKVEIIPLEDPLLAPFEPVLQKLSPCPFGSDPGLSLLYPPLDLLNLSPYPPNHLQRGLHKSSR